MGFQWLAPAPDRKRRLELASSQQIKDLLPAMQAAIDSSSEALAAMQHVDGYWCAELTADSTLESDYILLQLWLHPAINGIWHPPTKSRIDKACQSILERQLADGGWNIFPQGPSEVNATVRSYTALKLGGHDVGATHMRKALERVLALGGLQACNSYTKINFSLFDLFPRKYAPTVPPEVVLLPGDILYEMSSWTRAIVVPLSIVQAISLNKPVPAGFNVEELYKPGKKLVMPSRGRTGLLFSHFDKVIKLWNRRGLKNVRLAALREAEHWMLDRTRNADGLGAIYPSMMYHIMALDSLHYADDHPDRIAAIRNFENLLIETEDRFQFQPCFSPIWDTSYAAFALGEMGKADQEAMRKSADWMLDREVRRKGDWSVKRPGLEPSGWAFEFANEHYPDIDDTAMVLLALLHAKGSDPVRQARVEKRAINWLLGMQSSDGGWAAFDVDCNWDLLNKVPFADHNAMLDPTCADITGRVLEALCRRGFTTEHTAVQRGVHYLLGCQESNGSWYGRWGVNYVYGTFLALRGLEFADARDARPAMIRAMDWLVSVQNADGGWGESCAGYAKNRFVPAESTPSQTAWALLGLHSGGDRESESLRRGLRYLIDTQKRDGTWDERLATGTGFPGVFYLSYHMYRQYFPLLALTVCRPHESVGSALAHGV